MQKRIVAMFLSVLFMCCSVFPVFAYSASPSDAEIRDPDMLEDDFDGFPLATGSNAVVDDFMANNWGDSPSLYSSIKSISNNISYSSVRAVIRYYGLNGESKYTQVGVGSDGHFSIQKPNDFVAPDLLYFTIRSGSLPKPGRYCFEIDYSANTGCNIKEGFFQYMQIIKMLMMNIGTFL